MLCQVSDEKLAADIRVVVSVQCADTVKLLFRSKAALVAVKEAEHSIA
jgi:hypothetical protein